jgi:Flp pilus assembly protein TadB
MERILAGSALLMWAGVTLVFAELRWFRRVRLSDRLRPYVRGGHRSASTPVGTVETLSGLIGPAARSFGSRVARLLGVSEELELRLRRIHSPLDVTGFRVRQLGWSLVGFGVGTLSSLAFAPPLPVVLLLAVGGPLLAFLIAEQQVALASERWQRSVFLELPVIAEQLAMLTAAGYSLVSALNRVALRGGGACARDLGRVTARVGQGLTEAQALREWSETVRVDAVDRLVKVLELNRQASDLGALLGTEARAIRRDVQRELMETIERRSQQVWIPVTVATLVPGVIFISIPFITVLQTFRSP